MKPYETYPTSIKRKDRTYDLNLSFKAVFLCLEIFNDEQLEDEDKIILALDILIKGEHPRDPDLLEAILYLLKPKTPADPSEEKTIDVIEDYDYIVSSFRQAYQIDLVKENIHYQEFITLLNGLPEGTKIVDVVRIRTMKIPQPNEYNKEQIADIIRLKNKYALQGTKPKFDDGLASLFNSLKGRAE